MTERREQITVDGTLVTVIRSDRRQRTVSLEHEADAYILRAPASLPAAEVQSLAERLVRRMVARSHRRSLNDGDALRRRANELNRTYFGDRLRLNDIRYVTNQKHRFGSCTPALGTIRISDTLASMPAWVRDYVIVHELAHLAEPNHGPRFWTLVNCYPLTERARGYLMAIGAEPASDRVDDDDAHDEIVTTS